MTKLRLRLAFIICLAALICLPLACASADMWTGSGRIPAGRYRAFTLNGDAYIDGGDIVSSDGAIVDLSGHTLTIHDGATFDGIGVNFMSSQSAGAVLNIGTMQFNNVPFHVNIGASIFNVGSIETNDIAVFSSGAVYNIGEMQGSYTTNRSVYDLSLSQFSVAGVTPDFSYSSILTDDNNKLFSENMFYVSNATDKVRVTAQPRNANATVTFWKETSTGAFTKIENFSDYVSEDIPLTAGKIEVIQVRIATNEAGNPVRAIYSLKGGRASATPTLSLGSTISGNTCTLEGTINRTGNVWDLFIMNAEDTPYDKNTSRALEEDISGTALDLRYDASVWDIAKCPNGKKSYALFVRNHENPTSSADFHFKTTEVALTPIEAEWYYDNEPTVKYTWSLAKAMEHITNNAGTNTAHIKLLSNVTTAAALRIDSGKTVVLDLNGKTIDRGLKGAPAVVGGSVIINAGTLTINDNGGGGKIKGGNTTTNGGGINNAGTLTINGGSVTENAAEDIGGGIYSDGTTTVNDGSILDNSAANGGGGVLVKGGTFNMSGGSISDNSSEDGAGIYLLTGDANISGTAQIVDNLAATRGGGVFSFTGTFNMSGGEIKRNTAVQGSGIYNSNGQMYLSGGSVTGNSVSTTGGMLSANNNIFISGGFTVKENIISAGGPYNLHLGNGQYVTATAAFTGEISVTTAVAPTATAPVVIAKPMAGTSIALDASNFVSDNPAYGTRKDAAGNIELFFKIAPYMSGATSELKLLGYTAFSVPFTVDGAPTPTLTKVSGSDLITLDTATNTLNVAAGLPTGTYEVKLKASNGVSPDKDWTYTLVVCAAPTITRSSYTYLDKGYSAQAVGDFVITGYPVPTVRITAGDSRFTWDDSTKVLNIPAGLEEGSYTVQLTATNVVSPAGVYEHKVYVYASPTITGDDLMTLVEGYTATSTNAYTISGYPAPTVRKTSGDAKITWNDATKKLDIAAGLTDGTYIVEITATNGVSPDASHTFTLMVNPPDSPPALSGESVRSLREGYAAQSTSPYIITGYPAPTMTKASGDSKITWNATTNCIDIAAGLTAGTYPVVITATNGISPDGSFTFTLTVNPPDSPPAITGDTKLSIPEGYAARSTSAYAVTGNPAPTVTKTSGDSKITWNDTTKCLDIAEGLAAGTYPVALKASNNVLPDASLDFTLTITSIAPPTISIYPSNVFPQGNSGGSYDVHIGAGTSNADLNISNLDDDGLTLENGTGASRTLTLNVDYTKRNGSIIVTLKQSFLDTLPVGSYTLRARIRGGVYSEQRPSVNFTVLSVAPPTPAPPKTGDAATPIMWLALCSLAGACAWVAVRGVRKKARR